MCRFVGENLTSSKGIKGRRIISTRTAFRTPQLEIVSSWVEAGPPRFLELDITEFEAVLSNEADIRREFEVADR